MLGVMPVGIRFRCMASGINMARNSDARDLRMRVE